MSQPGNGGDCLDLQLMKMFDFKASFNVVTIYDSDEKITANEIDNYNVNQSKDKNDISGIEDTNTQKTNQTDTNNTKKNKRPSKGNIIDKAKRTRVDESVSEPDTSLTEIPSVDRRGENLLNDLVDSREEKISSNNDTIALYPSSSPIRPLLDGVREWQSAPFSQPTTQCQQNMTNTSLQNSNCNNNTKDTLCPLNTQSVVTNKRQTSEINHNEQICQRHNLNSQNITRSLTQLLTNLSLVIVPQNHPVDMYSKALECVATLLMKVSCHLISILKTWIDYVAIFNSCDRLLAQVAYKHFRETRSHFFNQSYTAVSHTILPQEKDQNFVKNFIVYTLELAKSRNINFIYLDMKKLLDELLAWVKSNRNPLINELLHKSTQAQSKTVNLINHRMREKQGNRPNNANDASAVSYGSPNIYTYIPVINSNLAAESTTQQLQNTNSSAQSLSSYEIVIQHHRPEPQRNASTSSFVQEHQASITIQENQHKDPRNHKSKQAPKQRIHPHQLQDVVVMTPAHNLPPLPQPSLHCGGYELSAALQHNYSEDQLNTSALYNSSQAESQPFEVINRSLSRDSGIVSPLSSMHNHPMRMMRSPENDLNEATMMTPLITHVTSLNPSANYIKDGICFVCRTPTKQKCLGCYKRYYCSNQCQIADWMYHAGVCK